jgi:hypothetical protein
LWLPYRSFLDSGEDAGEILAANDGDSLAVLHSAVALSDFIIQPYCLKLD